MPQVRSAFSTERTTACEAATMSTTTPLRDALRRLDAHAQDAQLAWGFLPGNQCTDLGRTDINCDDDCFIHRSPLHSIIWRVDEFHADQLWLQTMVGQVIHHTLIHHQALLHVTGLKAEVHFPSQRIFPTQPIL